MSQPFPVFLINLARSTDRLADASRQLAAEGMEFERIEAVEGRTLGAEELGRIAPDNSGRFFARLTPGEIGCYLSHLRALQVIADRALPAAVVFEDDFLLEPGFAARLRTLQALGSALPDAVKLYGVRRRGEVVRTLEDGRCLVRSVDPPICSTCTLWTLEGASKMLAHAEPMLRPVDVDIKHWWERGLDVQWMSPPAVSDSPAFTPVSTIGSRRSRGLARRLAQWRYRGEYALEREWRFVLAHGPGAWIRSFRRVPRPGRTP